MQLAHLWHAIVAITMIIAIVAHIYIGSVGMEGAFDAMGNGQVDLEWARQHHDLWVEEEEAKVLRFNRWRCTMKTMLAAFAFTAVVLSAPISC